MRASFSVLVLLGVCFLGCGSSESSDTPAGDGAVDDTHASGDSSAVDSAKTGDSTATDTTTADGATDTTASDTTSSDGSTTDAVKTDVATDTAPTKCTGDGDCRKFSVECDGKCQCLALSSGDKDPVCGTPSECFVDPCQGKTARCGAGNVCVVE